MDIISIPLPFSAALLAGVVAVRVLLLREGRGPAGILISLFFALLAVQGILSGLRYGYSISFMILVQPVLAMFIGPLAYLAFRSLGAGDDTSLAWRDMVHILPALPVAAVQWFNAPLPVSIDLIIWCSFVFYAFQLCLLARKGPDSFENSSTRDMVILARATLVTATILLLISVIDAAIYVNIVFFGGAAVSVLLSTGSLLLILIMIATLIIPPEYQPGSIGLPSHGASTPQTSASADDLVVFDLLEKQMMGKKSYLDANINITRIARQLNLPARAISRAVNRVTGQNFSQYVNRYRVDESCRMLRDTEKTITEILYEAGFQTKSNFNREFQRSTGLSPSAFRSAASVGD